jgi:anti-sigma regulatory factor (Ser/Thr protein kinase)
MGDRDSEVLALDLRCNVSAPSRARAALSRLDGFGWSLGDVILVASELVTNALRHSGCTDAQFIHVRVRKARDRLLISVADPGHSGRRARAGYPVDLGAGGVGLWVVEQLSRRWGTERDGGYRVWAELPLAA